MARTAAISGSKPEKVDWVLGSISMSLRKQGSALTRMRNYFRTMILRMNIFEVLRMLMISKHFDQIKLKEGEKFADNNIEVAKYCC